MIIFYNKNCFYRDLTNYVLTNEPGIFLFQDNIVPYNNKLFFHRIKFTNLL